MKPLLQKFSTTGQPGHRYLPLFVSFCRLFGTEPKTSSELVRRMTDRALLQEDKEFIFRLGRSYTEKHKPEGDWLNIFLITAWVEIPCWRRGGTRFPGLMLFSDEDIAWLFGHLMPWAAEKSDGRKDETASPRAVRERIKKLGLIRYPSIIGKIHQGSPEKARPYFTFRETS
jgi:hypothetical protein